MLASFHSKIGKNYSWELSLFYKYRDFSDGVDLFEFKMAFDKYIGDHNPQFDFCLRLFNFTIFEFNIHNIWHTDNPNSPYYGMDHD